MKKAKEMQNGITLIALVITIIVLLILAGISLAMLTGDNGLLTKAGKSSIETDIAETKEQIKLEILGSVDDNGNYTNTDVINAVYKITKKNIEEGAESVESLKGHTVDLSDLWLEGKNNLMHFTLNGVEYVVEGDHIVEDELTGKHVYKVSLLSLLFENGSFDLSYLGAGENMLTWKDEPVISHSKPPYDSLHNLLYLGSHGRLCVTGYDLPLFDGDVYELYVNDEMIDLGPLKQ